MRLDLLIQSFLRGTKRLQKSLSDNLDALEFCSSVVKSKTIAVSILDQYEKADQLIAVVEILGKLNKEILLCQKKLKPTNDGKRPSKPAISKRLRRLEKELRAVIESNSPQNWDEYIQAAPPAKTASSLLSRRIPKSPASRTVTLLMPPTEFPMTTHDGDMPSIYGDESDMYWSDEHHKFMRFPDKDWFVVIQENNLSYQNLHLVAPANFVTPTTYEYVVGASLPWITEQDVSRQNFDVMREELERVLKRTRSLQDKVWKAADLSVRISGTKARDIGGKRVSISWHTKESGRGFSRESARSEISTVHSSAKRSSLASASLNLMGNVEWRDEKLIRERERLTKVNIYEKYPQMPNRWSTAVPDPVRCLPQKDVSEQGNLYQKTKLKLFVPEKDKKICEEKRDLITPDSIFSSRSYRGAPSSMRMINKLKSRGGGGLTRWHKERIEYLVDCGLKSELDADRIDAAVSLYHVGALDKSISRQALLKVVKEDMNPIVKLQAAKALLNMGVCSEDVIQIMLNCLANSTEEAQIDLLECISNVPDVQGVFQKCKDEELLKDLLRVLREKTDSSGFDQKLAFQAAVCLVELCDVTDTESLELAKTTLKNVALFSDNREFVAKSLEVLTKSLDARDEDIFNAILTNMKNAISWRHRLSASLLLAYLGPDKVQEYMSEEEMYEILGRKVWDDPKREVRLGISQAATALGMRPRLLEDLDKFIRDSDEELRSRAVIAMSAVGIHSDATLRCLNEMLDLDDSDYVRLQIIRTFRALNLTDIRAVRAVRERERAGGPLAKAAQKFLAQLDAQVSTPKSGRRMRKTTPGMSRKEHISSSRASFGPWTANTTRKSPSKSDQIGPVARVQTEELSSELPEKKRFTLTSIAVRKSAKLTPGTRLPFPGVSGSIIKA